MIGIIEISDRTSKALRESYDMYFNAMMEHSGKVAINFYNYAETILLVGMLHYEKQIDTLDRLNQ